jgi:HEAT repeat protein
MRSFWYSSRCVASGVVLGWRFSCLSECMRSYLIVVLGITGVMRAIGQERDRTEPRPAAALSAVAWEVLDKSLSDGDERNRQQAVLAGGSIGPTADAVKFVARAQQDKSALVRQTAALVLGGLNAPESIAYLRGALQDNAEVSFTAARALCARGEPDGCEFLQEVLKGDRKEPKPGFVEKNLKYAKRKLTPTELAMMGVREASGVLLGPASLGIVVGEEAVRAQTSGRDKGESGRTIAATALADDPDEYTRILLEWALQDPHAPVRAAAARGLGKRGNAQSIPKLQAALNDGNVAVRCMAAATLIYLNEK